MKGELIVYPEIKEWSKVNLKLADACNLPICTI